MSSFSEPTVHDLNVAGLRVHVYAPPDLLTKPSAEPIAALFVLAGRLSSAKSKSIVNTAIDAFKFADEKRKTGGKEQRDFIVITFDQRNHGHREVDPLGNEAWTQDQKDTKHNVRHAIDMYGIQTGTSRDVSFVIDFLPSYLFPNAERTIGTWAVSGISLGGHATWLALRNDPRVRIGIPIIGCPDYTRLLAPRAAAAGLTLSPPYFPASLRELVQRSDPIGVAFRSTVPGENPFLGKRILVLSGGADTLVPWAASQEFVDGLEVGPQGRKKVHVCEGVEHAYPPEMKEEMLEFFWEEALVV
ncbi:hypothetical protein EVG20_g977 [Dentipellis fragilis]|uniref:Peptidase S9 prolyl oligopeptidase catalytic domain-containing protein n=1 Tax=Dentipellis fragilis TaxID=205917 RepID=A0A4Y9ZC43_9AGAM|nr:hypothetical protein EVG20_g977 [Dentipellis fragilis]